MAGESRAAVKRTPLDLLLASSGATDVLTCSARRWAVSLRALGWRVQVGYSRLAIAKTPASTLSTSAASSAAWAMLSVAEHACVHQANLNRRRITEPARASP